MNTSSKPSADNDLAQQIFDVMIQVHGNKPTHRAAHAKGIMCQGTFASSGNAAALSKAAHFQKTSVPVTIRFSEASPDPSIPDNSPDAGPRGMAIRFHLPGDGKTDIVALSHNGFVVSNGEEFLALQKAAVATDPSQPHPWPIEVFLSSRPLAVKFVTETRIKPASFATESFFSNNAFMFVNKQGAKQAVRYKILPVVGQQNLTDDEAKAKSANFLTEELRNRLTTGPVQFRLVVQLPNAGDSTKDSTVVWPDDRKTIDAGTISITSVLADSADAEEKIVFDPTHLTDGIELSDDPLPALRAQVYSLSAARRQQ